MSLTPILVVLSFFGAVLSSTELLKNGDFSSDDLNGNWKCYGCKLTLSEDAQHGQYSGKVTQRPATWTGVGQTVAVQPEQRYVFKGFVKLLNTAPGYKYHTFKILLKVTDQNNKTVSKVGSVIKFVQQAYGWTEVGFDYTTPPGTRSLLIRIQITKPNVNFLVDNASFKHLAADSNWKSEANSRIEQLRKADIDIKVQITPGTSENNLTIELYQTKSEFAFGSAISATLIVDPDYTAYQNFFYDNFEWAVIENALKWKLMEKTRGNPDFNRPMAAIRSLQSKGVKVRGHTMFWAIDGKSPSFLNNMTGDEILQEMRSHVDDMINHTRGSLEHWDVYNENLHGDFFERKIDNADIITDIFSWINNAEENVKLFLNDYGVVNSHAFTTAYKSQAKRMKEAGVPLYGVGVQGHFKNSNIDMTTLKYRLDKIAEAGLPVWITELSIEDSNENSKADALEDVYTLFFSHPAIEGVLLWGYWDRKVFKDTIALAYGDDVTPNAAGKRYQELFKRWRTHQTLPLSNTTVRGFKGKYTVNIMRNGQIEETRDFTLDNAKTITVNVQGGEAPSTQTTIA